MSPRCFILLFGLIMLFSAEEARGQCIDSNRINPWYPCEAYYNPVCGCDGKTYRNSCAAYWQGGNNYNAFDGTCDEFDFDFYPNPTPENLNFAIVFKNPYSSASVLIYDLYGKLAYQRNLNSVMQRADFIIEVGQLLDGMYVLYVVSGNKAKSRKFVKMN